MRNVKTSPFCLLLTLGLSLLFSGCKVLPVVPTLAVIPTRITNTVLPPTITSSSVPTDTPTLMPTETPTVTPVSEILEVPTMLATLGPLPSQVATLQVTYGPISLSTIIPSPTFLPTIAPTSLPTIAVTAVSILATQNGKNAITFTITEAQLNTVLMQTFAASPLTGYTQPPQAALRDGSLDLTLNIIPANMQASALTVTLTTGIVAYEGALETRPTHLEPLNAGVTTRQVKPGEALLRQAFEQIARQVANGVSFTYGEAAVHPEGVSLTLLTTPH